MRRGGRLIVVLLLSAMLGWAGIESFRLFRAAEALARIHRELEQGPAMPLASAQWSRLIDELARAEGHDAGNPALHELRGLLAVRRPDDPSIVLAAPTHYGRALQLRPVSAATWANLAEAHYLRGSLGDDFEAALRTAVRLGPAQPHVQRMVAHYGLAVWNEVRPSTRASIDSAVAAGMRRNVLETLQIAQRRGRLPIACAHLAGRPRELDPSWTQLCRSREASR